MIRLLLILLLSFSLIETAHAFVPLQKPSRGDNIVLPQGVKEFFKKTMGDPVAFFTFVLSIIAIIQIGFLIRADNTARISADAAKESALVADESLKTLQRPFVFIKAIEPYQFRDPKTGLYTWRITPIWGNSGNTPTLNLSVNVNSYIGDSDLPTDWKFPPFVGDEVFALIGPHGELTSSSVWIKAEDLVDVQNKKKFFYIWGFAKYSDRFKGTTEHVTRFAWKMALTGDPTQPVSTSNPILFNTPLYSRHNCSDEECENQGWK